MLSVATEIIQDKSIHFIEGAFCNETQKTGGYLFCYTDGCCYVEYPGGENPSPQPRIFEYVAGNAEWSHADGVDLGGKWVYSEVFTSFYNHSSSCSLSGRSDSSGIVAPGVRSYSRVANGYIWDTAYAYYWVDI